MKKKSLLLFSTFLFFALTASSQIKIYSGGAISMGTTSSAPGGNIKMQVFGNSLFTATTGSTTSSAYIRGLNAYSTVTTPDYTWRGDSLTGIFHNLAQNIQFTVNGSEKVRFSSSNITIAGNTQITSAGSIVTTNSTAYIRGNNGYSTATTPDYTWWYNDQTGFFHPASNTIGFTINGSEKMRISSSGYLGIGTTSPVGALDVRAGVSAAGGTAYGSSFIQTLTATANNNVLTAVTISPTFVPGSYTNVFSHGLDVVVGNATGIYSHSASGDYGWANNFNVTASLASAIVVSLSGTPKFTVSGAGDVWGKSATWWSDRTLKENIVNIQGALNKILMLNGVTYNFIADKIKGTDESSAPSQGIEMGLIAQDVEQVVPEVVRTNENGLKGIMYQNLIPLLIEGIKEQKGQIDSLREQLKNCCNLNQQELMQNGSSDKAKRVMNNDPSTERNSDVRAYLFQNNPNPFNEQTNIRYFLPLETKTASLMFFDMQGKLVKTLAINNFGASSITINANELWSGMFIYSLIADGREVNNKRMILTE